jgi:alpha-2-macroglobulin
MRLPNFLFIVGITCAVCCSQCGRSRAEVAAGTPEFHPLVSAFTSGLISAESGIILRFAQDFPDSVVPNTPVGLKILEFTPEVEGEIYYLDQRTVEFRPRSRLSPGVSFRVRAKPGKLFPDADEKKTFEFGFHVIAQHLDLVIESFRPYSDYNPGLNYLTGSLQTSDAAEPQAVEEMFKAFQGEMDRDVTWEHVDGKLHRFVIDSITRGTLETEVNIHYDGSLIGSEQKGVETFTVPSLGDFRVISHLVVQYPEQHVVVSFSDPIQKQQYLQGLIRLETATDLRFAVEGNNILVYPVVRQNGSMGLFIEPGIRNTAGKGLPGGERLEVTFEQIEPAVEMLGNGVIIPNSGKVRIPFRAVNLKAVEVRIIRIYEDNVPQFLQVNTLSGNFELKRAGRLVSKKQVDLVSDRSINYSSWNTFSLDLTTLVETEPGAIYRVEIGFGRQHSLYPCPGDPEPEPGIKENSEDSEEEEISYWDSYESYYYDDEEYYYGWWNERDDPCKKAYFGSHRTAARNILASNLGIIAKKGTDGSLLVTVTGLLDAAPLENVRVQVFNFQHRLMGESNTGQSGMVSLMVEGEPFLVTASLGEQRGYLKLNDGSSLSLSMFDVSGNVVRKGIKAFLYGERGVWRPGDSVFINMILDDSANPLPDDHPVRFEMKDPAGRVVSRHISQGEGPGFYCFFTTTRSDAPTGRYSVTAEVGGVSFTKMIRIETIKPNRLKVDLAFRGDTLYPDRGAVRGTVTGRWLTGAIARELKAEVEMVLKPSATTFKGYEGYHFQDPGKELISQPVRIFSGQLDEKGTAAFSRELEISGHAPGNLYHADL